MTYEEYVEKYKDQANDSWGLRSRESFERWRARISVPRFYQK